MKKKSFTLSIVFIIAIIIGVITPLRVLGLVGLFGLGVLWFVFLFFELKKDFAKQLLQKNSMILTLSLKINKSMK